MQSAASQAFTTGQRKHTAALPHPLAPAVTPDDYRVPLPTIARELTPALCLGGGVGAALWAASTFVPILGMGLNFIGGSLCGSAAVAALLERLEAQEDTIRVCALAGGVLVGCAFAAAGPLLPAILAGGGLFAGTSHLALDEAAYFHEHEMDAVALSGHYRTAPLFRDAVNRKGNAAAFAAEVDAVEALERNGWTVQGTRSMYACHEIGLDSHIGLHDPNGCQLALTLIRQLPTLSGLLGHTPLPDAPELQSAVRVMPLVERGVSLAAFCHGATAVVDSHTSGTVSLVGAIEALRNGNRVAACSGRVVIPLDSLDFNAAATRLEELAPLFEACQKTPALAAALVRSWYDANQALGELLLGLSSAERPAHVQALATLAAAGPAENGGLMKDYRALLASRDAAVSLEQSTAEYATLLSSLTRLGHAESAHETYAVLREAVVSDKSGEGFDIKAERFVTVMVAGGSIAGARNAVLRPASTASGTVERAGDVVRIGGVAVPVRH